MKINPLSPTKYVVNKYVQEEHTVLQGVGLMQKSIISSLLNITDNNHLGGKCRCRWHQLQRNHQTFSIAIHNTMRKNLLNWCNLVSISKNVAFYASLVVRIYQYLAYYVNIY